MPFFSRVSVFSSAKEHQDKGRNRSKPSNVLYENNVSTTTGLKNEIIALPPTSSDSEEITSGSETLNIYEKLAQENEATHEYQQLPRIYENII